MKAGACEACMNGQCCSSCWCCPWPKSRRAEAWDAVRANVARSLAENA